MVTPGLLKARIYWINTTVQSKTLLYKSHSPRIMGTTTALSSSPPLTPATQHLLGHRNLPPIRRRGQHFRCLGRWAFLACVQGVSIFRHVWWCRKYRHVYIEASSSSVISHGGKTIATLVWRCIHHLSLVLMEKVSYCLYWGIIIICH